MLFDSGDLHWPGSRAPIRYPGGILSFRLGEGVEGVLEFLLKCTDRPYAKGITQEALNDGSGPQRLRRAPGVLGGFPGSAKWR